MLKEKLKDLCQSRNAYSMLGAIDKIRELDQKIFEVEEELSKFALKSKELPTEPICDCGAEIARSPHVHWCKTMEGK